MVVVFQVVVGPAQAEDGAEVLGEVEGVLAEQGEAVVGGAVVGAAAVRHAGVDRQALVDLVGLAAHVEGAEHVLVELALRRGQAEFLGVLGEVDVALVVGGLQRQRGQAIAVLVLGVVPVAPGGDRGQGEVAELPVGLAGQPGVGVLDVGLEVAVDLAVVVAGHHRAQRGGERRVGDLGDHPAGRVVVTVAVVAYQGELEVLVRLELQLAAHALAVIAVDVVAVVDVLHVAVVLADETAQRALEHLVQAPAEAEAQAVLVAAAEVRVVDVAAGLLRGVAGHDVEHAGRGVLAEQGALRAAQHFDALHVEQVEGRLPGTAEHHAVDHRGHGRLDARRGGDGADATNEQRGVLVRRAGAEVQGRHLLDDARHVVAVVALQLLAVDHRDRHRHLLQRGFAAGGGDRHGAERRRRPGGGLRILLRLRGTGGVPQRRQQDAECQRAAAPAEGKVGSTVIHGVLPWLRPDCACSCRHLKKAVGNPVSLVRVADEQGQLVC
ncbi:hypothetical protein D9M68_275970 [compost metagenome]